MTSIPKDEPFYQISQVSKLLNITADRLRTYEEEGLIKPHRTKNSKDGKRLFTYNEIEWLETLRELIKLGVTIPVIRIFITGNFKFFEKGLREKDKAIVKLVTKLQANPNHEKIKNTATKK